jgi:hypothetical protein
MLKNTIDTIEMKSSAEVLKAVQDAKMMAIDMLP